MTAAPTPPPHVPLSSHLQKLFAHSAIYGSQDAAAQVINLALTPLYVWILTPTEVGLIVVLFTFSAVAKVVFRLGLANTRSGARQLVSHGHVQVNGARAKPAREVAAGDRVEVRVGQRRWTVGPTGRTV